MRVLNLWYAGQDRLLNATASPESYTLSLHDALPIYRRRGGGRGQRHQKGPGMAAPARRSPRRLRRRRADLGDRARRDRKSTRLNSSHVEISYAVFCLKKKN